MKKWLVGWLLCALSVVFVASSPPQAYAAEEQFLGEPLSAEATGFKAKDAAVGMVGETPLAAFLVAGHAGEGARFVVTNLTGNVLVDWSGPLPTASAVTYSPADRAFYFAFSDSVESGRAEVYRWSGGRPAKLATVERQQIVSLAPASSGGVYVGTFAQAGGQLYSLTETKLTRLRQPFPGQAYVRTIVADSRSVFVSNYVSSGFRLLRYDLAAGRYHEIELPRELKAQRAAHTMTLAGDYLVLRSIDGAQLWLYHRKKNRFVPIDDQVGRSFRKPEVENRRSHLDRVSQFAISGLVEGRYVFFQRARAGLMRLDLSLPVPKAIRMDKYSPRDNPSPMEGASAGNATGYLMLPATKEIPTSTLVAVTTDGQILKNQPGHAQTSVSVRAQGTAIRLWSVNQVTGGRIALGGFHPQQGLALFDPITMEYATPKVVQIEGAGSFQGRSVFGGYTGGAQDGAPVFGQQKDGTLKRLATIGHSQERPVALAEADGKLAIGTIPGKEQNGGALSLWDPRSGKTTVKRNLIPGQSVISLVGHGKRLVGGSSNTGGTGAKPTPGVGQIFTYDPATDGLKTMRTVDTSGAFSWVAAITPDPEAADHFWAIATGRLIQFRVEANGQPVLTRDLGAFPKTSAPSGRGLGIAFAPGKIYATLSESVMEIDRASGKASALAGPTSDGPVIGLVRVSDYLYYARGAKLFRLALRPAVTDCSFAAPQLVSPQPGTSHGQGPVSFTGTGTPGTQVSVQAGGRNVDAVVGQDGSWRTPQVQMPAGRTAVKLSATKPGCPAKTASATLTFTAKQPELVAPTLTSHRPGQYYPAGRVVFAGRAQPGSQVKLRVGSQHRVATVEADGRWEMAPMRVSPQGIDLVFEAHRPGAAPRPAAYTLFFGPAPKKLSAPSLLSHRPGQCYPGASDVRLAGRGIPGAKITARIGSRTRVAYVRSNGRWNTGPIPINPKRRTAVTVHYEVTAPGLPSVSHAETYYFGCSS
ncbi:MAG: hypothetical protein Q3997_00260 [Propionibacteriaceae bacterium]|nr:hypothetical protein [Propionibacteriaceae bacterium]